MQAYRFETRISNNGTIQLPLNSNLINKDVEIIIFSKPLKENRKKSSAEFVKKWAGFLSDIDDDSSKITY